MTLFSAGYQDSSALKRIFGFPGVIVDVRFNPYTKSLRWHQSRFQELFGERYYHCRELGNRGYRSGTIDVVNLEAGMKAVVSLLEVADVLLLCCCASLQACHRKVIIDEIERKYGIKTLDL